MTAATTNPTADERGLLAAARAGDERAFRRLVAPHERALEIHCYRMLGSVHDAQDVTQDVLLRAWRSLDRFERRSSLRTWLYRIATNACLDELERRPRRPVPAVDPYPDERAAQASTAIADPAARYAAHEGLALALLTAIQRLPGRQRAVLILRDVLGWTGAETADLLDTTVAAVNSALQRARATIEQTTPARSPIAHRPQHEELLRRYLDAWERDDVDGLVAVLRDDATLTMPPQAAIVGAREVATFLHGVRRRLDRLVATPAWANGAPALALREVAADGTSRAHRLLVLEPDPADGRRAVAMHAHHDPALLAVFGV